MEKILTVLKALKVNEYRLMEKTTYSKEWFFIGKKLDMSRAKKVRYYYLTVYQNIYENNQRYKGYASCKITDKDDVDVLEQTVAALVKEASYVKNPYFELPAKNEHPAIQPSPLGDIHEIFEMMADFHETEDVSLNSYELFENLTEVHLVNSRGIDVTYSYPSHELELVMNARDDHHEIEIYQDLRFGQPNVAELKHMLGECRRQAQDRKTAVPLTATSPLLRVIISKENVLEIFRYYLSQLNTDMQFQKYSTIQIGDEIGPENFHLEALPELENSSHNCAYDDDGRVVFGTVLVDHGVVQHVWGSHIYSTYLGLTDTTHLNNFKVAPGNQSLAEMKASPYLEITQFSSFSCQPVTGDFSGEIRLGYYFDGEKTTVVTGGSVSGNIKDNESSMIFSKELEKYDQAVVPAAILLDHVSISAE